MNLTHEEAIAIMREHGWVPSPIIGKNVRWIKTQLPFSQEKCLEIAAAYILPNIRVV